ncbi:MAG: AhpC/TSA family protein [Bacteroidetes bacterium]|nr:MAG: AhpC/TSA family protein [Bacteroidota bacterium]
MKRDLTILSILLIFLSLQGFSQLPKNPEDVKPLKVGEAVPAITLKSISESAISLKNLLREKPTVLIFYRGGWCPYCNQHLAEMADYEKSILEMGYQIVAVSPDSPENLSRTLDKNAIHYSLLSDSRGELIKAMGIAYKATFLYESIRSKGATGEKLDLLPVPSLFVVNQKGIIQYEYVNPDYRVRMSGEELSRVLSLLKK